MKLPKNQQLLDIIEFLPDATFMIDNEGRVIVWNQAIEELTGVPKTKILGKGEHYYSVPIYGVQRPGLLECLDRAERELGKLYQKVRRSGAVVYAEVFSPYLHDGKGAFLWLKARPFYNKDGQQIGAIESIRDVTERYQVEEKLKQNYEKLQKSLKNTINSIAKIIEVRDPYTAGHQQNVATLACSIAKDMKLSGEQIECIRVAGLLHDLGKIYIPADLLCKPSRLSEAELMIVQTHPEVAYDILKAIDFSGPVAEAVLQHHERMNGSGYPFQLNGKEILMEARILGVADVVEAISHHRPYRPALGIGAALEEIQLHQGTLYDRDVVDTCLNLYAQGKLKFS